MILLELNHRVDWSHQDDVCGYAGVDAGGSFAMWSGLVGIVFSLSWKSRSVFAEIAVVGGDPLAIVRGRARFCLVE